MVSQMIIHETGNEVIPVIITLVPTYRNRATSRGAGGLEEGPEGVGSRIQVHLRVHLEGLQWRTQNVLGTFNYFNRMCK